MQYDRVFGCPLCLSPPMLRVRNLPPVTTTHSVDRCPPGCQEWAQSRRPARRRGHFTKQRSPQRPRLLSCRRQSFTEVLSGHRCPPLSGRSCHKTEAHLCVLLSQSALRLRVPHPPKGSAFSHRKCALCPNVYSL